MKISSINGVNLLFHVIYCMWRIHDDLRKINMSTSSPSPSSLLHQWHRLMLYHTDYIDNKKSSSTPNSTLASFDFPYFRWSLYKHSLGAERGVNNHPEPMIESPHRNHKTATRFPVYYDHLWQCFVASHHIPPIASDDHCEFVNVWSSAFRFHWIWEWYWSSDKPQLESSHIQWSSQREQVDCR